MSSYRSVCFTNVPNYSLQSQTDSHDQRIQLLEEKLEKAEQEIQKQSIKISKEEKQCLCCLNETNSILSWENNDQIMNLCMNCVFEFCLQNFAKNSFHHHTSIGMCQNKQNEEST